MNVVRLAVRKRVDVEKLLRWTYQEEMLKADGGGLIQDMSPMFRSSELGTIVDSSIGEPRMPTVLGPPHPDALLIDHYVRRLPSRQVVTWSDEAQRILLHGLEHWIGPRDPAVIGITAEPIGLLMTFARIGTRPRWDLGPASLHRVMSGSNPKVQYIDRSGRLVDCTTGSRNYHRGGRCPLRRDPSAAEEVAARFEYFAWHSALVDIANVSQNLADHVALPPAAPAAPWIDGAEKTPRIIEGSRVRNDRLTTRAGAA